VAAGLAWAGAGTAVSSAAPGAAAGAATRPTRAPTAASAVPASQPVRPAPNITAPSQVVQRPIRRTAGSPAPSTQPSTRATVPSSSPTSGGEQAPTLEPRKVAGALVIVLGLIFGLRWVLRRTFPGAGVGGSSSAVQVLSRTVLSPKQQLMLVRVGRRLVVVGDSGGQMSPLSEITDPDEVAALVGQLRDEKLSAAGPMFGGLLGRLRQGMEAAGAPDRDDVEAEEPPPVENIDRPAGVEDDARDEPDDPASQATRQEISGLMAKVRLLSHQFKGT
jgi:flagellar biosynthetic protein FliO